MNIDLTTFIKEMIDKAEVKTIGIKQGIKMFLLNQKEFKREFTFKFYQSHLRAFEDYCNIRGIEKTCEITNEILSDYVRARKESGLQNSSINRSLQSVKCMLNYLENNGIIVQNRITIMKLQETQKNIQVLNEEEIDCILKQLEKYCHTWKLMFYILASTGIRRNELVNIKIKNIDFENKTIFLEYTKTNNSRYIFFDERVKIMMLKEIEDKDNDTWLFEDQMHISHINPANVANLFKKLKKDANIERLHPHLLRHTFATHLLNQGVDLETIRRLLGHSDYSMLKIYISMDNKKLAKESLSHNPLASNNN